MSSNTEISSLFASLSVSVGASLDPALKSLALFIEALSALFSTVVTAESVITDGSDVVIDVLVIAAVLSDLIFNLVSGALAIVASG